MIRKYLKAFENIPEQQQQQLPESIDAIDTIEALYFISHRIIVTGNVFSPPF